MNTQFILYPNKNSYCKILINDLKDDPNIFFYREPSRDLLGRFINVYTSIKLNKYFHFPFQSIFYRSYYDLPEDKNLNYVFIFFQGNPLAYDKHYLYYLKKTYSNSRFVFYWLNIVEKSPVKYIDFVNYNYDYIYSFDKKDAIEHHWIHFDTMYSKLDFTNLDSQLHSDICFIGNSKGRLDKIHKVYDMFHNNGYICDFHVVGVDEKDQTRPGIVYNKSMSYLEVLKHSLSSKVILEIVQDDQVGCTLRTCEAISLRKILLTNNYSLKQSVYNGKYISFLDFGSTIDFTRVFNSTMSIEDYSKLLDSISPNKFIDDIKKRL